MNRFIHVLKVGTVRGRLATSGKEGAPVLNLGRRYFQSFVAEKSLVRLARMKPCTSEFGQAFPKLFRGAPTDCLFRAVAVIAPLGAVLRVIPHPMLFEGARPGHTR